MYIPTKDIYKEMLREQAYLWFVPQVGADNHAVLIKSPSHILKAITQGSSVEIIFSVQNLGTTRILCSAVKIYDDQQSPFIIIKAHRSIEEHKALYDILKRESTRCFLFDELARCVSWAECSFETSKLPSLLNLIGNIDNLYSGQFTPEVSHVLDCLEITVNPVRYIEGASSVPVIKTDYVHDKKVKEIRKSSILS